MRLLQVRCTLAATEHAAGCGAEWAGCAAAGPDAPAQAVHLRTYDGWYADALDLRQHFDAR